MRRTAAILLLLLSLHGLLFGKQAVQAAPTPSIRQLTLAEFEQETQRLESAVADLKAQPEGALALHQSIPDQYIVVGNNTSFTISNLVLKKSLGEFRFAYPQRKEKLLNAVQSAIAQMREGTSAFSNPASYERERKTLTDVLSRREFRRVSGQTKLEIWAAKLKLWLARLLMKAFGYVPSSEHGSQILTWVLIGTAIILLALWLMRASRRREGELSVERVLFAPSEKHWRTWLTEAKAAADAGNWRDAIHLAYWAGISKLEDSGAWVPDRARTPREYLKIMAARDPNRSALSALTKKFEVVWYGEFPAGASDYQETLRQLEAIGCR